jgi:hypothetical protein
MSADYVGTLLKRLQMNELEKQVLNMSNIKHLFSHFRCVIA